MHIVTHTTHEVVLHPPLTLSPSGSYCRRLIEVRVPTCGNFVCWLGAGIGEEKRREEKRRGEERRREEKRRGENGIYGEWPLQWKASW